jgi:hypothetical protein
VIRAAENEVVRDPEHERARHRECNEPAANLWSAPGNRQSHHGSGEDDEEHEEVAGRRHRHMRADVRDTMCHRYRQVKEHGRGHPWRQRGLSVFTHTRETSGSGEM